MDSDLPFVGAENDSKSEEISAEIPILGSAVPEGFLRPCTLRSRAPDPLGIQCDAYRLVEFRGGKASRGDDSDLEPLMKMMQKKFGKMSWSQSLVELDGLRLFQREFRTNDKGAQEIGGIAISITNTQGKEWSIACYTNRESWTEGFCGDAIAVAARAGGLAFVGAKPMEASAGGGTFETPQGCVKKGTSIECPTAQLRWSVKPGQSSQELGEKSVSTLREMAKEKKVKFREQSLDCRLFGKPANCQWVQIRDEKKQEGLHFVFVSGGEQESLLVCTFPGLDWTPDKALPKPCAQAVIVGRQGNGGI